MRISDWSSDVCSSDLQPVRPVHIPALLHPCHDDVADRPGDLPVVRPIWRAGLSDLPPDSAHHGSCRRGGDLLAAKASLLGFRGADERGQTGFPEALNERNTAIFGREPSRLAAHTSALHSLMRSSYP